MTDIDIAGMWRSMGTNRVVVPHASAHLETAEPGITTRNGSRETYGLTYAFCQESGSPLIASIAADVGTSQNNRVDAETPKGAPILPTLPLT